MKIWGGLDCFIIFDLIGLKLKVFWEFNNI